MGQLFLVIILVCIVCGNIPLLATSYMNGKLTIPKWLVNILSFAGIAIITLLQFPIDLSNNSLGIYLASYVFVGQFLRKEHTKHKWRFCMILVLLANCMGIFAKWWIIQNFMVQSPYNLGIKDVGIFLVTAQSIVSITYFITQDKPVTKIQSMKKKRK